MLGVYPDSPSTAGREIPARVVVASWLALGIPVLLSGVAPGLAASPFGFLTWLPALVPGFLLPYYRGWQGATIAFFATLGALALSLALVPLFELPSPARQYVAGVALMLVIVTLSTGWVAELLHRERARIAAQPLTDELTGLPKRRQAVLFLEAAWSRAVRGDGLAIVLFEVDGLRDLTGRRGNAAGDRVLSALGGILLDRTRRMDLSARFGPETFVSILVGCPMEKAADFAEFVRARLAEADLPRTGVTASAGVSAIEPGMGSADILLAAADRALFQARQDGGDRVCRADRTPGANPLPRPAPTVTMTTPVAARLRPASLDGLRALVVDDDEATLGSTAKLLGRLGCTVTAVAAVEEALRVLTSEADIDVLLTDIVMPEMSGFTLVEVALRVRPGLAVLYMSGHPHEEVYWGAPPGARSAFLQKPMEATDLRETLLDLLATTAPSEPTAESAPAPAPPATRPAPPAPAPAPSAESPAVEDPAPRTEGRILVVDDDAMIVRALQRLFKRAGYAEPLGLTDPRGVRECLEQNTVDLLILDLHMPDVDGFQVLAQLASWIPAEEYLPVLVLTGDNDPAVRRRALAAGAKDFLSKPFDPAEAEARARNLLETRLLTLRVAEQRDLLEQRVLERTSELADTRTEILHRLARAAEYRDDVTGRHADRVGLLASQLASELGLSPMEVDLIRRTAPLHDIGKIGVPDAVLRKPGRLTPSEYELMKTHTSIGALILGGSRHRILQVASEIAGSHHERWDGDGYPRGLGADAIPLAARIVAVADTFDTIAHTRPYKEALSLEAAVEEIVRCSGSHFDPGVVRAFEAIIARVGLSRLHALADPIDPLRDTMVASPSAADG